MLSSSFIHWSTLATCLQICASVHIATSLIKLNLESIDEAHEGLTSSSKIPFIQESKKQEVEEGAKFTFLTNLVLLPIFYCKNKAL